RATLLERLRGREAEIQQLHKLLGAKESDIVGLRQANQNLGFSLAKFETALQEEQRKAGEKLAILNGAQQKLLDAFKVLSAQALQNNNQSFLYLAQATLEKFNAGARSDLDKRQQAISELVRPVQDSLVRFDSKVQQLENARVGAYSALYEQIQQLRT